MMRDNRRRKFDDGNDDKGGGGRYFKKRRTSVHQERKEEDPLKCIILDVGEKTKASVESSIEGVAKVLEADLSTQKGKILGILVEMVTFLPEKCTIYSTLAGLLNAKNYNFGGEFVEALVKTFKDFLRSGNWVNAQYTLRFIADLVNCHVVSATSLLQLFDTFMEGAQAGETGVPQVRRDWFVYAILNTLPWVGRELYDKREQTVERLMIIIDNYMKKRKKIHHELLRIWATDDPHPQEEYLDCLWAQVEKLKMDGWIEKHIARPYLTFDSILCEALQHNLPSITLPPHHENMQYPLPRVVFRMFDYTDCPEGSSAPVLPGAHSIERFLIEQELKDILRKLHLERKECAIALLEYQNSTGTRVPLEYMIVEVIFGELFKLPTPDYLEICYGSILIELCKRQPAIIPQVLAQTTELLFTRIDTMNVSCIDRFASWFAYHLTNFQLRWSWDDWALVLQMEPEHPKPKFIQEVIYKCTRLSYLERISEVIPKTFASLLPEEAGPCYKYDADIVGNILGITQAKQLQAAFREKAALDEILVICKEIPNPMEMDEGHNTTSNPLAIDIFAQTIFLLGSKTLSHTLTAISKYQPIFKALVDGDEAQLNVLKAAYDVWKKDKQMLAISVEMLLKCQIIDFSSVANWVFTKEMAGEFTKIYLWEILHMSIRKMSKHVTKMTTELSEAREKLRRAEMNSSESENEDGEGGIAKPKEVKDIPNEEMVDKMEEKLEAGQADQKNLFLIVFQRFIMILSEHIAKCDTDGINFNTLWYRWTIGRLQQVFMQHADQVAQYSSTLETLLFTQDLDKNILQVFQQFQALRT